MALAAHQDHDYFSRQYMVKPTTPEEQQQQQQPTVFSAASNEKPRSILPSPNTPSSLEYPSTQRLDSTTTKRHSTSFNLAPASSFKNKANKQKLARNHTTGNVLPEPEVSEDFAKELSARQKAFRRLSRRPNKEEDDDRVLMGTRISEGHQNYILMYNMLTGIRIAVGRVSAKPDRPLVEQDFSAAHKLAFDV
jgi:hypothetical protein